MTEERCTLDYVDNISVSARKHHNNLNILRSLRIGMMNLAEFTRQRELEALKRQKTYKMIALYETSPETLMLGCVFDWFALSLVSYFRTMKLMDLMESNSWELGDLRNTATRKKIKNQCSLYVQSVAPAIYKWRHKIAAHRAATDPRSDDNLTMLTYSTLPPVSWHTPYYGVLDFELVMSNGGPLDLDPWQLTRTFEDLAPRFWPEVKLTPLPNSQESSLHPSPGGEG